METTTTFGQSNDSIPKSELRLASRLANQALRTQKANAAFAKLSPAKKRVALAKDVIKWIQGGKLRPAGRDIDQGGGGSTYLEVFSEHNPENSWRNEIKPAQLQEEGGKVNGYVCTACAIGGLIAVAAERDACKLFVGTEFIPQRIGSSAPSAIRAEMASHGLFAENQLVLIEQAYECGEGIGFPHDAVDAGNLSREQVEAAREFGKAHNSRAERLTVIMENIIANGGTFVP